MKDIEDNKIWCDECDCEYAEYTYEGEDLCSGCLLLKLARQDKIQTWDVNHYMINDEYCGNDNDNEVNDIIEKIKRMSYKDLKIENI